MHCYITLMVSSDEGVRGGSIPIPLLGPAALGSVHQACMLQGTVPLATETHVGHVLIVLSRPQRPVSSVNP